MENLIFPLLIIFMIGMIFFSSRQRKKQQAQQETLQNSLSVGDVVVMTSGISGTIVDTDDERTIDLEIAPDVVTTWLRAAVREKLTPGADEHAEHESIEPADAEGPVVNGVERPGAGTVDRTEVTDRSASTESVSESVSETRRS